MVCHGGFSGGLGRANRQRRSARRQFGNLCGCYNDGRIGRGQSTWLTRRKEIARAVESAVNCEDEAGRLNDVFSGAWGNIIREGARPDEREDAAKGNRAIDDAFDVRVNLDFSLLWIFEREVAQRAGARHPILSRSVALPRGLFSRSNWSPD